MMNSTVILDRRSLVKFALLTPLAAPTLTYAAARPLLNGKDLTGWEPVGPGVWAVMRDGTLVGQRDPRLPPTNTDPDQAWLYTKEEFEEFDLALDYWTRLGGNSGVSLRDTSRAQYSWGPKADPKRTPSHIGYEIQISFGYRDEYPTGSIYLFQKAKAGAQVSNDWNTLQIESRREIMRVRLNHKLVAEHAGDPQRPTKGPIGLQLHDRNSIVMFRNIHLQPIAGR